MTLCYYNNELCEGELWQCATCKEEFCQTHSHSTAKGQDVECVACERNRLEEADDASKEQTITLTLKIRVNVDPGVDMANFVDNLELSVKSGTAGAVVFDTEFDDPT
jgi:DNA-directed RNA polymerase subunit RPC12/RpoP